MFREFSILISLNLTKLDTSKIKEMNGFFFRLYIINFNIIYLISEVYKIDYMFEGCINLQYINIQNFNASTYEKFNNFFDEVSENVVICINNDNTNEKIFN